MRDVRARDRALSVGVSILLSSTLYALPSVPARALPAVIYAMRPTDPPEEPVVESSAPSAEDVATEGPSAS